MHLAADKIGIGVPPGDFGTSVHSVFRNACILAVDGDKLITLLPPAAGGLPAGITLAAPADVDFRNSVATGAVAVVRAGILRFAGSDLAIDLRGAEAWRSGLTGLSLDASSARTQAAWVAAADLILADGRAAVFARIADVSILALAAATRCFDLAAAEAAMLRLVGLGAGGTPAGDDFLVGHLAGLWVSRAGNRQRDEFIGELGRRLRNMLHRTNAVSRVYLEAAIEAEVSERLADLAEAMTNGAPREAIRAAAAAAIAVGHTSGADAVLGLLVGSAAWGPDRLHSFARNLVKGLARVTQP